MASDTQYVMSLLMSNNEFKGLLEGITRVCKNLIYIGGDMLEAVPPAQAVLLKLMLMAAVEPWSKAMAIAQLFPELRYVVLSLPHVVQELIGFGKNLIYVGEDLFEAVPPAQNVLLKIEDYLYQKKLYGPQVMKGEDWNLLDRQALGVIQLTLSCNVAFNIAKEKTPADSIKTLSITAVSNSLGSNKLKFDNVRDLVLSEEIRRRESGESSTCSVLHTELRGSNSTKRNERGRSSYRGKSGDRRSKSRTPNNSQNSKSIECWNCGKTGHYKNQCRSTSKNQEVKAEANVTFTVEGDDALICSLESKEESWVLDSGASFHATSKKKIL
uniref:CCHC-type domain-containing protein n=1 Tax=Chenopodium quinoa TaxID=63459 RepID=A0A803L3F4_CHEQI